MHRVQLAAHAARDLDSTQGLDLVRLRLRILTLESDPRPHGTKKLQGTLHRIRVGDWRILYVIDDADRTVTILRVLRRSERTYRSHFS